jgi:FixJ family two-component response regulator
MIGRTGVDYVPVDDPSPRVDVVDDDAGVLTAVARLLRSAGLEVRTFSTVEAFLAEHGDQPGCVVLDLFLPGDNGLRAQQALVAAGWNAPVIFLTGNADVRSTVAAMKGGAVDFLLKPFEAGALLDAVKTAIERDRAARALRGERAAVERRLGTLTPRERQVLACLLEGRLNKQIAAELGAAEKTIKVHRARVLEKMKARSIAALVQMIERAGVRPDEWPKA